NPTRFAAHDKSDRSPIAASRTRLCQSSNGTPARADRSATSRHEFVSDGGATLTRGGDSPSSATGCELIKRVTSLPSIPIKLRELSQGPSILSRKRRPLIRIRLLQRQPQKLPQSLQLSLPIHHHDPSLPVCENR